MANNTVKPKGEGWSAIINGVEVKQVNGGLMLGSGLDAVFIHGDKLRLVDPTTKMQGHYPDNYPFTAPHDHVFDEENIDLVLDRTYPYDGIPLELLPKAIRDLKGMLLGNVSIKANFPTNEITGEYTGTLQKGDLVTWDTATGEWVAATCPVARGLTDNALFTGVAFPDSDEILSASNVVCDAWDLTPGQAYYLDCANPGKMTDQDTGYYVGVAQSKTAMYFAPYASSVEQVITKLQEQVSAVDTAMQDLQSAFEGVQTTVEEMQAIVEEVKANDDQVNQKLQDLATQAQTTNGQLVDVLTRIGQLEATDAAHQTYFNSIASQFQTVSTTISNMASSLAQSDEEIRQNAAKMRQELDAINELLSQGAGKWAELVQKHEDDIKAINDKLGDCTCESITAKFEEQATAIQANTDAHNALQTAYDAHITDYQELKEGHNVLYAQVQSEAENIKANSEAISQLSSRTSSLEVDLTEHKATAANTFAELKAKDTELTGLIEANKGLIQSNTVAIDALRNDLTTGLATAQTSLDAVKENLQEQITSNDGELETLTTQVGTNTTGLASAVTRILNLENMLDEGIDGKCECDFSELNKSIADNAARITDLSNAHSVTANNVLEISKTTENLVNTVTSFDAKLAQHDTAIGELDLDIINAKNEFKTDQNKQNTTIQNLKDWVNGLEAKQSSHETSANEQFATMAGRLDALEAGGGTTDVDLTALSVKVSQNENGVATNKEAIEGLQTAVAQNTASITELRGDHVAIESSISKNTEAIATHTSQISTITSNITNLTNATNTINSTVTSVTERLTTVESAIKDGTCECDLSTVNKSISELTDRVTAIEDSGGGSGGSVDLGPLTSRVDANETTIAKITEMLGFGEDGNPPTSEDGSTLVEEINKLDSRLTTVEGLIGDGTGGVDLTEINKALASLTEKVTALETKNAELEAKLADWGRYTEALPEDTTEILNAMPDGGFIVTNE